MTQGINKCRCLPKGRKEYKSRKHPGTRIYQYWNSKLLFALLVISSFRVAGEIIKEGWPVWVDFTGHREPLVVGKEGWPVWEARSTDEPVCMPNAMTKDNYTSF